MKRAALVVVLLVVAITAILVSSRGHDVSPDRADAHDATRDVAVGTIARSAPHVRRPAKDADAAPPAAARRIGGVVVDAESDKPIVGAEILVARRRTPEPREGFLDTELPGEPELRAATSADGKFGVDVAADGPWFVTARAAEHVDAVKLVRVGDDARLELAVGVEKTFTVRHAMSRETIPGAEVSVYDRELKGPPRMRRVSDAHGEARMRVRSGETLVVRAKGFARGVRQADRAEVLLVPGYRIAGVVRDRAGHGVAGAVLRFEDDWTWTSGADGRFVLDELPSGRAGRQRIEVTADSFATWHGSLRCGDADAVVELSRMGVVAGKVVLPDGSPAAHASLAAVDSSPYEERTDATGAFRIATEAESGRGWLSARWAPTEDATGEMFGSTEFDFPDGATVEGVVIRLAPKSFVPLQIVDDAGHAVTKIEARGIDAPDRVVRGDVVVLCFEKPAGARIDVKLTGTRDEWRLPLASTTQASADGAPLDLRLPAPRPFTATVLASDGSPLPADVRPKLSIYDESGLVPHEVGRSDEASATWNIDAAPRHALRVEADGFADVRRVLTPQDIERGQVSVRLEPGVTVHGRVVATDPNAVGGAKLSLDAADASRAGLFAKDVALDADGAFRIGHVAPGTWRLTIRGWPWTVLVDRQIQVAGDADIDLGDVVLPTSAWLHGVVRTPDGRPCGGAAVQLNQPENDYRFAYSVLSQDDGSLAVYVPTTGRRALLVRRTGFGAAVARLDGVDLANPVVVHVAPEGKLDVRIRLPRPHASAWSWHVRTPDGAVCSQPDEQDRPDDKLGFDDRYVASGLPSGPLVVVISSTEWTYTATVSVVAGATTPVVVGPDK